MRLSNLHIAEVVKHVDVIIAKLWVNTRIPLLERVQFFAVRNEAKNKLVKTLKQMNLLLP
jgi:hypothetical protein